MTEPQEKTWTVGTLRYDLSTLINVFFWMLWGDFCLNLMELVIPRIVPLQLTNLGASNALIGILTGSVFSLMNWVLNPIISTASDRHRGKLGRRMPFILFSTPPLAFFLVLIGFAGNIAAWLHAEHPHLADAVIRFFRAILPDVGTLPGLAVLTIGVMAVMMVCYKFFDFFPTTVYYYLFSDVIPQGVMGTFTSLFRVCATIAGYVFHRRVLGHATTHPRAIYLGAAALYMVAFLLLVFMVKEGDYPPPPPKKAHPAASIWAWARESFSLGYYWKIYFTNAAFMVGFVPFNVFLIVYAQKALGMTPGEFGYMFANVSLVQLPVFLFLGPVVDRLHPVRAGIIGYIGMIAAGVCSFHFVHDRHTFFLFMMAVYVSVAIYQGATAALGPRLLPRYRYGQFCAANAMVCQSGLLVGSWACGKFLDVTNVRFVFFWFFMFATAGLVAIVVLYRHWMALGGDEGYVPPEPEAPPACAEAPVG